MLTHWAITGLWLAVASFQVFIFAVMIQTLKAILPKWRDAHPAVASRKVLLRLCHGLMCRSMRSKPIAVMGERRVPPLLQNLPDRLLDEAIQHGRDAKLAHPSSIRFRDFHPLHRFRFVGPIQQLVPKLVLLEIVAKLIDGHPVDAGATFVAPHLPQCFLQVCSFT